MDVGIYSTGFYVPSNIISNDMWEESLEKVRQNLHMNLSKEDFGIKETRFSDPKETSTDMAYNAIKAALESGDISPKDVDLLIYNSSTPDHIGSPDGYFLQEKLGLENAATLTMVGGCSGFISALITGEKYVKDGTYKTVVIAVAESVSKICGIEVNGTGIERSGAINAGDGAAAVVIKPLRAGKKGIISADLGGDGKGYEVLMVPAGGMRMRITENLLKEGLNYAVMDETKYKYYGHENKVVSPTTMFAIDSFKKGIVNVLSQAQKNIQDINWLIPHQPNIQLIHSLLKRMSIPKEKLLTTIDKYACPWSAAVPITLAHYDQLNTFMPDDLVVMVSFGGGFGYGAILARWCDKKDFIGD